MTVSDTDARGYISGGMHGHPRLNFKAFDTARDHLHAQGYVPISPADLDRVAEGWAFYPPEGLVLSDQQRLNFLMRDLQVIAGLVRIRGDFIYMLKGWESSKGAPAEKALAEFMGLGVVFETDQRP